MKSLLLVATVAVVAYIAGWSPKADTANLDLNEIRSKVADVIRPDQNNSYLFSSDEAQAKHIVDKGIEKARRTGESYKGALSKKRCEADLAIRSDAAGVAGISASELTKCP